MLLLVAKANHRCWARLLIPGCSDCSDAETDPQGYSAPIPIPNKKLFQENWAGDNGFVFGDITA